MEELKNKVAGITGAGIGRAICLELLRLQAHVALIDINPDYLKETAALCKVFEGKTGFLQKWIRES